MRRSLPGVATAAARPLPSLPVSGTEASGDAPDSPRCLLIAGWVRPTAFFSSRPSLPARPGGDSTEQTRPHLVSLTRKSDMRQSANTA
jgi:hypothetical protein